MKMGGDGRKTLQQRLGLEFALNAKGHINWKAGRYICHIEGHHLLSSTRHDEIGEAMQFAYDHVCFHLIKGGCGNAVVFDTYSRAVFERIES
jgi:hypothetical protein